MSHSSTTESAESAETCITSVPVNTSDGAVNHDGEEIEGVQSYSALTKWQKYTIVCIVGSAAFFSTISSSIFFPAITEIAADLQLSIEKINLLVTVYLIFQAITPSFWAPLADVFGRRLISLSTLAVYIGACLGITQARRYGMLIFLRCLQATGGSSVVAVALGTVADIAAPSERAGFVAIASLGPLSAPAIGPIVGAFLTQTLGWRSIFWILAAFACVTWVTVLLFLPETLRSIVGDGSYPCSKQYKPLTELLRASETRNLVKNVALKKRKSMRDVDFLASFKILLEKDIICLMTYGGILYAVWYGLLTSLASDFKATYNLSTVQLGLCFLPNGIGCIIGMIACRRIMDRDFKIVASQTASKEGTEQESLVPKSRAGIRDLENFPIEHARLRSVPIVFFLFTTSLLIYGWTLQYQVHISVPLTASFVNGAVFMIIINGVGTLAVDCFPENSSSATASNNLVRCLAGAGATAAIKPLIIAINSGPAFTLLVGMSLLAGLLCVLEWRYGQAWRQERGRRLLPTLAE
ncbi:MAG: hypothetical protein CYPHOPRED_005242 [Cyphobasidiales sp. Tagirdzhanova-0007]|nr:MAG: hypothetical protein CYPHOPRED_005242 [Cyphobasidiales sp. Tagirdzhanova-0007]